jgi:large subunit ribosomal protein L22
LRYKELAKAKTEVEQIMTMKKALPFKRFTNGLGHKPGRMASGRYPINACEAFLKLLNSVEANASNLTLGNDLKIVHLVAQRGNNDFRWGRRQRRQMRKNTHIEVVVKEVEKKKVKKVTNVKKSEAKSVAKTPVKEVTPKQTVKTEGKKVEEKKND